MIEEAIVEEHVVLEGHVVEGVVEGEIFGGDVGLGSIDGFARLLNLHHLLAFSLFFE